MKQEGPAAVGYRAEIDGLRALAVMPVILFHAGFDAFSGGFVGVDVFFVISGYLITSILVREHADERFSFVSFYERRARRILPALFFVVAITLLIGWYMLLPPEFLGLGRSVIAVVSFSANIFYWLVSDYFAPNAETLPLLHTWSLAVEEQFYVVFPILITLVWRFRPQALCGIIIGCALISLSLAEFGWRFFSELNFYMAPSRAWELMIGALIACLPHSVIEKMLAKFSARMRDMIASLGVGLIFASVFLFDEQIPSPSLYILVPCIGTALVIVFGSQEGFAKSLLTLRPVVFVGLISFSAYLWHQPLLAYARLVSVGEPPMEITAGIVVLTIFLAWVTWRFIEAPFRDRSKISRRNLLVIGIIFASLLVGAGGLAHFTKGSIARLTAILPQGAVLDRDVPPCGLAYLDDVEPGPCQLGTPDVSPSFMLIGDSHALALSIAVHEVAMQRNISGIVVIGAACIPFVYLELDDNIEKDRCQQLAQDAIDVAVSQPAITDVIFLARWPLIDRSFFDNAAGGIEAKDQTRNWLDSRTGEPVTHTEISDLARSTFQQLIAANKTVSVVKPIPPIGWNVPAYAYSQARFSSVPLVEFDFPIISRAPVEEYISGSNTILEAAIDGLDVVQIDPLPVFCSETACRAGTAETLWYFDDDHLSKTGAMRLIEKTALDAILRATDQGLPTIRK